MTITSMIRTLRVSMAKIRILTITSATKVIMTRIGVSTVTTTRIARIWTMTTAADDNAGIEDDFFVLLCFCFRREMLTTERSSNPDAYSEEPRGKARMSL